MDPARPRAPAPAARLSSAGRAPPTLIPAPQGDDRPHPFDHSERPGPRHPAVRRGSQAGQGEGEREGGRTLFQRVAHQHQGNGGGTEQGQRRHGPRPLTCRSASSRSEHRASCWASRPLRKPLWALLTRGSATGRRERAGRPSPEPGPAGPVEPRPAGPVRPSGRPPARQTGQGLALIPLPGPSPTAVARLARLRLQESVPASAARRWLLADRGHRRSGARKTRPLPAPFRLSPTARWPPTYRWLRSGG